MMNMKSNISFDRKLIGINHNNSWQWNNMILAIHKQTDWIAIDPTGQQTGCYCSHNGQHVNFSSDFINQIDVTLKLFE